MTIGLPLFLILTLAPIPTSPLENALENFRKIGSYSVTLRSGNGSGEGETIRYTYKKPGFIRMEFVSPHSGALLVFDPNTGMVRLRPFGMLKPLVMTLSPDNSLIKSSRGHRVDASDIGSFLKRVKELARHGSENYIGEERIHGRETIELSIAGAKGFEIDGVHRYLVWLEKKSMLPLKTAAFDKNDKLLEEVNMDDLEIDLKLAEGLFQL
jgi:outer membrane lipoprotein-sorting protein